MGAGRRRGVLLAGAGLFGLGVALRGFGRGHGVEVGAEGLRWLGLVGVAVWCAARRRLTPWIFFAMVLGAEVGVDAPRVAVGLRVFSDIFLRLIKTIVAPLILATLVTGIAGHGDLKGVGRIGVKALVYFEVVTTLALVVGLVAINLTRAGVGLGQAPGSVGGSQVSESRSFDQLRTSSGAAGPAGLSTSASPPVEMTRSERVEVETQVSESRSFDQLRTSSGAPATAGPSASVGMTHGIIAGPAPTRWDEFLLHVFPENIAKSVAEGQILQVAVFAVLFGVALATLDEGRRRPVLRLCESLSEVMFRFTNVVMYFAPVGVGAAMAYTVGQMGLGVLVNLGKLLLTLYGALAAFGALVLLPVAVLARVPVGRFLRAVAEPATIAFATSTSEAALPRAMEAMEALGVPRRVVSFVIPAGYSFNLDGSTLYLAVASIFVAQAGGVHLRVGQQLLMMGTLVLTSKGVAGVPRATLVVLLATAATFGLPTEPIFVVLGVDALMDMARTTVNVVGNCLASVVVARWEGVFGTEGVDAVVLEGVEGL